MSSWARLTLGAPGVAAWQEAPLVLFGRNDVPLMWSCGFSESDLRRGAKPTEEDDGGWQPFWFETTTAELTRRFEALSKCLGRSESAYPREVWEGCAILVDALLAVPGDAPAVLDPNEVAQMSEVGVLEASLIQHMRSFAERGTRSGPAA